MDSAYVVHHLYTRIFLHSSSGMRVGCSMAQLNSDAIEHDNSFNKRVCASSGDEGSGIDDITQDIHEQHLVIRFDYLKR
jgi:hypothetical protein